LSEVPSLKNRFVIARGVLDVRALDGLEGCSGMIRLMEGGSGEEYDESGIMILVWREN